MPTRPNPVPTGQSPVPMSTQQFSDNTDCLRTRLFEHVMSHAKALYKNNMIGLPTKVSVFDDIAYDETGTRVSYSEKNNGTGIDYTEVSVPGVGVFRSTSGATGFSLDRQDLVAGGFRKGNFAYFPVTDAQGNVRGYATTEGLVSAMDYYPYGTVVDLVVDNTDSRSRWQSREFDGEHG